MDDYVMGAVLRSGEMQGRREADPQYSAAIIEFISGQLATGAFPRIAALSQDLAAAGLADPDRVQARFERGLALLIEHAAGVLG